MSDNTVVNKLNAMLKKFNTEVYRTGCQEEWADVTNYYINNNDMIFNANLTTSTDKIALSINGSTSIYNKNTEAIQDIFNEIKNHVSWLY